MAALSHLGFGRAIYVHGRGLRGGLGRWRRRQAVALSVVGASQSNFGMRGAASGNDLLRPREILIWRFRFERYAVLQISW